MGISMKGLAKYVWLPTWILAWGSYVANTHPEVVTTAWSVVWAVDGILSPMYNTAVEAVSKLPVVWEAAPFAFPMVAWGSLGYKLADLIGIENKILKHATAITGTWLWAAASQTVLAPYLWLYWVYRTGKFLHDKQVLQRTFNTVVNSIMKVSEATKKLLVDPFIAMKKWLIDNQFEKPNYKYN